MPTTQPTRIVYPTFVEHLQRLRATGTTFAEMARRLRLRESTIIGWASGGEPNRRVRAAIEEQLTYSFVERRFAEAATAAEFPPADAPEAVRALTTFAAVRAYLIAAAHQVPQDSLGAFFGLKPTTISGYVREIRLAPEGDRLVEMLRRLPELPRHLSGEILSPCTPKAVLGRLLRDCRQARGAQPEDYATRIGISHATLRTIEDAGLGRKPPSQQHCGQGARKASFFFRREEDLTRILAFLTRERAELRTAPAPAASPAAPPPSTTLVPAGVAGAVGHGSPPAAAPPPVKTRRGEVRDRLQALLGQHGAVVVERELGIPRSTLRGIVKNPQAPKPQTIKRVADAIAAYDRRTGSAGQSPPAPAPTADAAPPSSGAPPDLADRVRQLEASLATLIERARARDGSSAADAYISPLSSPRFQPHDDVVSDEGLTVTQAEIRRVCERLGHLASIADDQRRRHVQQALGPLVDELFVTIEGFLRAYPSGALVTLDRQRRFHADQRGRLMADSTPGSAPPPPGAPERKE